MGANVRPTVRIAVVGSGLAGLTTAYLLHTVPLVDNDGTRVTIEVHLYEKDSCFGMDKASVTVGTGDDQIRVDSPMRSINGGSHGRVWKLYKHLGVSLRASDFTYSFSRLAVDAPPPYNEKASTAPPPPPTSQSTLLLYEGSNGLKWPPLSFPTHLRASFHQARYLVHLILLALSYIHLLVLAFLYQHVGFALLRSGILASTASKGGKRRRYDDSGSEPLVAWCERHWVWKSMREEVLEPLVAAVATVGRKEAGALPVEDVLSYITSTFGSSHYVARFGVQEVVALLSAPLPSSQIHFSSAPTSITPSQFNGSTRLHFDSSAPPQDFDHVVLATQANQASALLASFGTNLSSKEEKRCQDRLFALNAFTYAQSLVITHTDADILPHETKDRRDLNLASFYSSAYLPSSIDSTSLLLPPSFVQATHLLSHPSRSLGRPILQTTNPIVAIDPEQVLSATWYERAVPTQTSRAVLPRFLLDGHTSAESLQGRDGVWFVGSYCAAGIPLLEGCVSSAENVVKALGLKLCGKAASMPY